MFQLTFALLVAAFLLPGILGVRAEKDASSGERKASASAVVGVMMGAIVGGASTIGTVQMAYEFGLSACWFTVGAGRAVSFWRWDALEDSAGRKP